MADAIAPRHPELAEIKLGRLRREYPRAARDMLRLAAYSGHVGRATFDLLLLQKLAIQTRLMHAAVASARAAGRKTILVRDLQAAFKRLGLPTILNRAALDGGARYTPDVVVPARKSVADMKQKGRRRPAKAAGV